MTDVGRMKLCITQSIRRGRVVVECGFFRITEVAVLREGVKGFLSAEDIFFADRVIVEIEEVVWEVVKEVLLLETRIPRFSVRIGGRGRVEGWHPHGGDGDG